MKILVPIKRVVDHNVKVRVKDDNSSVDIEDVKMSINPFDEIALEEAIRFKESGKALEVIAVTIGSTKCEDILRTALAMGADSAILIESDNNIISLDVAKALSKVTKDENCDLVLLGKQAIDSDSNQTGQMLATMLDRSIATFASKIELNDNKITVSREVDEGIMTIKCNLPSVITVDLRLNEPRYPSLPNIMKARSKPIKKIDIDELQIGQKNRIKTLKVEEPPTRGDCQFVESTEEIYKILKEEVGVI